jgi:predicted metalloprotease
VSQCLGEISSTRFELLADCFAEAWMGNAEQRGNVTADDVDAVLVGVADTMGDPTHGSGAFRLW